MHGLGWQATFVLAGLLVVLLLFAGMLAAQEWGRRIGERHRTLDGADHKSAYGATEGAVFALLGLFLAFAFSGAGTRFDARRQLVVAESNAIGTAWLRISVLPQDRQPELRGLFREYLDSRIETYRLLSEGSDPRPELGKSIALQQRIWERATAAAASSGQVPPYTVLLPALNEMIDLTTTRTAASRQHPPLIVYLMIAVLALVSALYIGYGMAGRRVRSLMHTLGFAAVTSIVMYVILDLEFPRLGFVRIESTDQVFVDLRISMN